MPVGRQAGVGLHLTSLPGAYGIGELGAEARRFIDFIASAGIRVWQFLPTGPTSYGDSPYQPLSSFSGNEMLIAIDALLELELLQAEEITPLLSLPSDTVDFGRLIPLKRRLLARAASRFTAKAPDYLKREYQEFLAANDASWLNDYALFRALKTEHDERPWPSWNKKFANRKPAALEAFVDTHGEQLEAIKIIQFLFHAQWQELKHYAESRGVFLFGDMPIYVALDSADTWANRKMLQLDNKGQPEYVAGVPPDYFSSDGQLWGNPLYDWQYHADHGYQWWIDRLRHAAGMADMIRIDHFRGFESYWSVPADEKTARNGRWVQGPGDELFAAVRNALGHLPIIAEDLGVITPEVEGLRDRNHLPGMVVLQFVLCDEDFNARDIREYCVCYTGTHDNDTTRGWFEGNDDDTRSDEEKVTTRQRVLNITKGSAETVSRDVLRLAMNSRARLVVAPLQDYLGLDSSSRFNTPGKADNNWRWRVAAAAFDKRLEKRLLAMTRESGRGATPG